MLEFTKTSGKSFFIMGLSYDALLARMEEYKFDVKEINNDQTLFEYLV